MCSVVDAGALSNMVDYAPAHLDSHNMRVMPRSWGPDKAFSN